MARKTKAYDKLFWGNAGNETVLGTAASDALYGAAGDDALTGEAGNDALFGGDGNDYLTGGSGNDLLSGGSRIDWADYAAATSGVRVDLNDTRAQNTGGAGIDWLSSIERLQGSAFADLLIGNGAANLLKGGSGADTVLGGSGDDQLFGDAGDDRLDGGTGRDYLQGGLGNDTYLIDAEGDYAEEQADGGIDTVITTITDRLDTHVENLRLAGTAAINGWGNTSDNLMIGNDAANTIFAYEGRDTIFGGGGDDVLGGGDGDDTVDGGAGSDTFTFTGSPVATVVDLRLQGVGQNTGRGVDTLTSVENLVGSDVADVMIASSAVNRLEGALGADTYRFFSAADLNGDVIVKATGVGDVIDLSGIDANTAQAGDQAFALVSAFGRKAGEAVYTVGAGSASLQIDVNGDGVADAALTVLATDPAAMGFLL
jgi:serralysin